MKNRIKISTLALQGILYRLYIMLSMTIFVFLLTHKLDYAVNFSVGWATINIALYYIFHYLFAKHFSLERKQKGCVIWATGLPCSGKSTIMDEAYSTLTKQHYSVVRLDGDIVRQSLTKDLGFSKEDREENLKRITFVANLLSRQGIIVLCSFVSPYRHVRENIKNSTLNFVEVFVDASPEVCATRDVKGMWKKAKEGIIKNFTGYNDPYEVPLNPDIHLNTEHESVESCSDKIVNYVRKLNTPRTFISRQSR